MNGNSRNLNYFDDENLFGLKKKTYWEIYGVKRFPYRGKRKFTPLLYQSLYGGMVISNDVFGLTISQFERMYTACLERRKTKEQWILNLRYPDKSSKEYLEYLENCTDCNTDHLRWNDPREKHLYENLVHIVGTELDMRKRQRLFIIQDRFVNSGLTDGTQISSGSLAEGIDLPGSDMDIMYVMNNMNVIPNVKELSKQTNNMNNAKFFVMETDIVHPGFIRLQLVARQNGKYVIRTCCHPCSCEHNYLSAKHFLDHFMKKFPYMQKIVHGPCISNKEQTLDLAFCIRSYFVPSNAIPWASRHRWQWPPNFVIDRIINYGCLLVPIGPKILSNNKSLWRVSFSVAEKNLVYSFNLTQFLCYGLLKLTLKRIINTNDEVKDLLCSYFLKTALFWVSEQVDIKTFQLSQIYYCFTLCLKQIMSWVSTCYCPNYFIPEQNMFLGKIDQSNNTILLCVLESILCGGIYGLLHCLFPLNNAYNGVISATSESSSIILDFLLYRNMCNTKDIMLKSISNYFKALSCIEYLLNSESCKFIIDACKFHINSISSEIVHLLPPPNTKGYTYSIHKLYHTIFQRIIKIDAVSGWLLYASFYYVTKQFKVTLRITDYIQSKWSPYLMMLDANYEIPDEIYINKYKYAAHVSMTLKDRVTIATAGHVHYTKHSPLIPEELQLEIEFRWINILPNVMSRCLRFLCYHHLGELCNRRQALRDLYLTMKNNQIVSVNTKSNEITILGVCFEISGDKDMAYQCYDEALQCDEYVCPSAEGRRSKLFEI